MHEVDLSVKSDSTWFPLAVFKKKIGIQFCDSIRVRINFEDAMIEDDWRTVNDAAISNYTSTPLNIIITKVRSNVNDGFVNWIEFCYFASMKRNALKIAVFTRHSFKM